MTRELRRAKAYRKASRLTAVEAAYLAGLIDGEGTVTLSRVHRSRQRGLVVTISNTELAILQHVRDVIGVGTITSKRISRINHTPSYAYHVADRQALDLLEQIGPFMKSHKAARAKLVLDHYLRLTPRNGRYTQEQLAQRDAFIHQFFEIRPAERTGRPRPVLTASPLKPN
ncbi:MAG: LAGLIDADG family homing endonuclease [Nitrospirae bacterium]|nr:LAGLIDADG family homing endonuclease [Nitrospirota bacterium]